MLSQFEIDALLGAADATPEAPTDSPVHYASGLVDATRPVKTYDFRRPDKFSKDQLRTLQAIHENIARMATARLSARMRSTVTIALADTSQMIYDEFVQGLTLPTRLVVLGGTGFDGPILMDLDLGLALGGVERMLGGVFRIPTVRREPTAIEGALMERIVEDLAAAISEGWGHLVTLGLEVTEAAFTPSLLRVAAPSDVIAAVTFEVRLATQTAPLTLCYPHSSLETVINRLSAQAWYGGAPRAADHAANRADLAGILQRVSIPITAQLGAVELSVETLAGLKPGDTIRFGDSATSPISISIMNQARAWALPGRVGDRIALRIVTPLEHMEG